MPTRLTKQAIDGYVADFGEKLAAREHPDVVQYRRDIALQAGTLNKQEKFNLTAERIRHDLGFSMKPSVWR